MSADTLTDQQFAEFSEVLSAQLGIKMPAAKKTMLQGRLYRRVRDMGLSNVGEYYDYFFSHPGAQEQELEHLINLATTNKTDFFREIRHFNFLVERAVPEWKSDGLYTDYAVWSAGCSSGEEPYSIAMTLMELQEQGAFSFSVLATDISTRVLQKAVDAVYPADSAEMIPEGMRKKYLLRGRNQRRHLVRIAPEVRNRVRFGLLNFLSPHYGAERTFQIVFVRNVLIYFDREKQEQIVERLCRHLVPGGYLFIGHSESLHGLDLPLESVCPAIYRKI